MDLFESNRIEFKAKITDQLVREIVAFLNTDGGKIYIGISDDGKVIGTKNIDESLRIISDIVCSQIEPSPIELVKSDIHFLENQPVIVVNVDKGTESIYCIKKYGFSSVGCPIRVGSTCREMSQEQVQYRYKMRYSDDDLLVSSPTNLPELSFVTLKNYYSNIGLKLNDENFKNNLNLLNKKGQYNKLAELVSDNSRYSFIFVKFEGANKASLSQRSNYGNKSILFAYEQMKNRIEAENICISDTTTRPRIDKFLYNIESVDEAIINAIVHNDWSVGEPQVAFFNNRIEIISHGGLPHNLTKEEYFAGITKPRNAALMKIFSDLDIADNTGHGIPTIIEHYGKDVFDIEPNHIIISIPFDKDILERFKREHTDIINFDLNELEKLILEQLSLDPTTTAQKIALKLKKSRRTIERYLKSLQAKDYIERVGTIRNGYWKIIK